MPTSVVIDTPPLSVSSSNRAELTRWGLFRVRMPPIHYFWQNLMDGARHGAMVAILL